MSSKERINQALRESGVKASFLASHMGINKSSVSEMLSSDGEAPEHYIGAVAELTGFLPQWLRTGIGLRKKEIGGSDPAKAPRERHQSTLRHSLRWMIERD